MAMDLVTLSNAELQRKGEDLANAVGELYKISAEKKEVINDFKSRIARAEKTIGELSLAVRTGKELRSRTFFDSEIDAPL